LGPDINDSELKFTVNKEGNIRFGLGAIKGVGESAVEKIIEERNKKTGISRTFLILLNELICTR
jgi:DNA polymerase III subunit alpha